MVQATREDVRRIVSHYCHRYRHVQTELKGRDLKAMGFPPGPLYSRILNELLDARLNGQVRSRAEELEFVKARWPVSEKASNGS